MTKANCIDYPRKGLYLVLTVPMLGMYAWIAVFLARQGIAYLMIYAGLFVLVAVFQSYVCVHWGCPYVGRFAPCVGGFCQPSSQLARLFKGVKRSERTYKIMETLAFVCFFGIILFPLYFLYRHSLWFLLGYLFVVGGYATAFLLLICPVCATRKVCPGGQTAVQLQKALKRSNSQ